MKRSQSITLLLVGSTLILQGCKSSNYATDPRTGEVTTGTRTRYYSRYGTRSGSGFWGWMGNIGSSHGHGNYTDGHTPGMSSSRGLVGDTHAVGSTAHHSSVGSSSRGGFGSSGRSFFSHS